MGARGSGLAFALVACSSTPSAPPAAADGGCVPYAAPAVSSLQSPPASFKNDVLPIFVASCTFTGCHNDPSSPLEYLGNRNVPMSSFAAQVYSGIVSQPTIEAPSMPFVAPGDPTKSFLMHKLDQDLCVVTCAADNSLEQGYAPGLPCGVTMPINMGLLDVSLRDTIRRWIAQGAPNN